MVAPAKPRRQTPSKCQANTDCTAAATAAGAYDRSPIAPPQGRAKAQICASDHILHCTTRLNYRDWGERDGAVKMKNLDVLVRQFLDLSFVATRMRSGIPKCGD